VVYFFFQQTKLQFHLTECCHLVVLHHLTCYCSTISSTLAHTSQWTQHVSNLIEYILLCYKLNKGTHQTLSHTQLIYFSWLHVPDWINLSSGLMIDWFKLKHVAMRKEHTLCFFKDVSLTFTVCLNYKKCFFIKSTYLRKKTRLVTMATMTAM
jgi:hypothetical protein